MRGSGKDKGLEFKISSFSYNLGLTQSQLSVRSRLPAPGKSRAGDIQYRFNEAALSYMREQGLVRAPVNALEENRRHLFHDALAWEVHLSILKIEGPRHRQIATEAALLAARGLHERLAVVSDDAGQFNVLRHALCCIHAGRLIPRPVLRQRFDALFTQKTRYQTLNQLLQRLYNNKAELLLVLERPEIPAPSSSVILTRY